MSWTRIEPKRSGPSPRHCHSAISHDGKIYVFGGTNGKDKYNDLYCFDPGRASWGKVKTTGHVPSPRYCAAMGVYRDSLILFGGFDGSRNNSIYSMHIPTSHWTLLLPAVGSSVPLPRSHHCLAITGHLMYIFGGLSEEAKLLNDLHVFDLERLVWKALIPDGTAPCGRINHSAHILGNFFVVFGGYDGKLRLNDLIFFNLDTNHWTNPLIHGIPPSRRLGHTSVVSGDKLLIFGGDDGNKERELLNDLHIFDLSNMRWSEPELSGCPPPQGRTHASFCITSEDQAWLIDGSNSQKVKLDEIFRFDLAPLHLFQKMLLDRASASILRDLNEAVYKLQVRTSLSTHLVSKRSESSKKRAAGSSNTTNATSSTSHDSQNASSSSTTGFVSPGSPLDEEGSPLDGSTFNASASSSSSSKKAKAKKIDRVSQLEHRGNSSSGTNSNIQASSSSGALNASSTGDHSSNIDDTSGATNATTRPGARSPKKRRHKTVARSTSAKHDSNPMPIHNAHSGGPTSPMELSPTTSPRNTAKDEIPIWSYMSSGGTGMGTDEDDRGSDDMNAGGGSGANAFSGGGGSSVTFGGSTSLTFGSGSGPGLSSNYLSDNTGLYEISGGMDEEVEHPIVARARRTLRALQHSFHELSLEKDEFMRHKQERLSILAEAGDRDTTQGQELNRLFQQQKTKVTLNVGGFLFTTSITTLTKYPDSMLATMFSGRHTLFPEENGTYFIDRDGTHFRYILNYLRCGEDVVLEAKPSILSELLAEARFYQLEGLKDAIQAILSDPNLVEEPIVEY